MPDLSVVPASNIVPIDQLGTQDINAKVANSNSVVDLKSSLNKLVNELTAIEKKLEQRLNDLNQIIQDMTLSGALSINNAQSAAATTMDEAQIMREEAILIAKEAILEGLDEIKKGIKEIKRLIAEMVENQL